MSSEPREIFQKAEFNEYGFLSADIFAALLGYKAKEISQGIQHQRPVLEACETQKGVRGANQTDRFNGFTERLDYI